MIDRRLVLGGLAASFGASLFAPLARAEAAGATISHKPPAERLFSAEQRALLAEVSERIMPTTDTPGAKAAAVPDYIEQLLFQWAADSDKQLVVAGLDAIDAQARADHAMPGQALSGEQLDALLTRAMNGQICDPAFFPALKQMVLFGYYTSEIGVTVERVYLPVPGTYDGGYPYAKVGRIMVG
ncbi:gluconate 2-dehydrogenase subunit 3 family protein [Sphingobium algorifonticola]|uniref:Gluconate 2-dehydrogenase subunit 3 family protein n=1 Tax=Sphingobium algorifonticola TaxID=2008318 RepID=A0A437J9Y2_9SPHN|nr:gluconate 2-dehydrogenase subunit 3 family protein [Sphingobium algorifonticola]RVT42301.1 gluconate 2-dehydrogenase subunit 3 family protein [Sphingobium algorifonticola]